jgi:hypothetical protein
MQDHGEAMATEYETGLLFDECWQELRKLHKTLAELRHTTADGWQFLEHARVQPVVPDSHLRGIDPDVWRQRAKEVRTFAELAMNVSTKNAFLEIAKSYDDLAASQESSN